MRIVAGKHRGRRLLSPSGDSVRPSAERLREALFNIVAGHIEGARVLDLFAGTGALGLEALSRGALKATFVEKDPRTCRILQDNIAALHEEGQTRLLGADAIKALSLLQGERAQFDLIVADPPYHLLAPHQGQLSCELILLLTRIEEGELLAAGGELFIEAPAAKEEPEPPSFGRLKWVRTRRYGGSLLLHFICPA